MLRCLNCGLRVQRIQRHVVTTLPQELLIILSIWLRIDNLPMEDLLCHGCYVLIQNADVNTPRTLGHTNVCAGCGCSLKETRLHFLEENGPLYEYFPWIRSIQNGRDSYAVCHNCWRRASRQAAQDSQYEMAIPQLPSEPAPAPAYLPDQRSIESAPIYFPRYKRAASTSQHCIYTDCGPSFGAPLTSPVKKRKPTTLSVGEQEIIINVYKYVKNTWPEDVYPSNIKMVEKVSEISGVSKSTIYRVLNVYRDSHKIPEKGIINIHTSSEDTSDDCTE
ncbi:unnamed protein product [Parnassius apollo]|uniref:(apollo) hypothetical protein n=1 Tax=Parnassius apollo TaxID=110799 RepID=A0A8S3XFV0_PARAO|nr:unnamed protein product [Parnassius apollo]